MPVALSNMMSFNTSSVDRVPPVDSYRAYMETLEVAGKMVEKQMTLDNSFPTLTDRMRISEQSKEIIGLVCSKYSLTLELKHLLIFY